jgi:hypothetical protein
MTITATDEIRAASLTAIDTFRTQLQDATFERIAELVNRHGLYTCLTTLADYAADRVREQVGDPHLELGKGDSLCLSYDAHIDGWANRKAGQLVLRSLMSYDPMCTFVDSLTLGVGGASGAEVVYALLEMCVGLRDGECQVEIGRAS